jgi:hypothetical protein
MAKLNNEIKALQQRLGILGTAKAVKIDFENIPSMCGYDFVLFGTDAPTAAPDFISQIFIDKTNKIGYLACGTNAADWKRITNA